MRSRATRLREIRDAHGPGAIATYLGNPSVHDMGAGVYLPALLRALGTKKRFSASSVDQLPKHLSSGWMFGGVLTIPIPDVDRTDYMMVLGANPLASNGSLMTAPDMPGRLKRLRERGGRLVVVDPRRSETADAADEHVFVRPGTDSVLLLAMLSTLITPTEGAATVAGHDLGAAGPGLRRRIGVLAHLPMLYEELTPAENLRFFARLYDLDDGAERTEELLRSAPSSRSSSSGAPSRAKRRSFLSATLMLRVPSSTVSSRLRKNRSSHTLAARR